MVNELEKIIEILERINQKNKLPLLSTSEIDYAQRGINKLKKHRTKLQQVIKNALIKTPKEKKGIIETEVYLHMNYLDSIEDQQDTEDILKLIQKRYSNYIHE